MAFDTGVRALYASQAKADAQLQDLKVCLGLAQSSNQVGQLPDIVLDLHLMLHGVGLAGIREDVLHK